MEDYNSNYDDYNYNDNQGGQNNSLKGYKVIILILAIILAALSFFYFRQVHNMRADFRIERDTLTNRISNLIADIDSVRLEGQVFSDSITTQLGVERDKADSLMERLQKERSSSRATIRKYEKELGTLRTVMRRYVSQIDSLNQLNEKLASENVTFRRQVSSERSRANAAEERATELDNKIRTGSVIRARDITLTALNEANRPVTRAAKAQKMKIDFILSANDLAQPGGRYVYARITGPDGYVLAVSPDNTFSFEGDRITYSAAREVDYANEDLPVGLYYNGAGITDGTYLIEIYIDGAQAGSREMALK